MKTTVQWTGEEETHICCDKRLKLEGANANCCYCHPHKDCEFSHAD